MVQPWRSAWPALAGVVPAGALFSPSAPPGRLHRAQLNDVPLPLLAQVPTELAIRLSFASILRDLHCYQSGPGVRPSAGSRAALHVIWFKAVPITRTLPSAIATFIAVGW